MKLHVLRLDATRSVCGSLWRTPGNAAQFVPANLADCRHCLSRLRLLPAPVFIQAQKHPAPWPALVVDFHLATGVPADAKAPTVPDAARVRLRADLIAEETEEIMVALGLRGSTSLTKPVDLPAFADGLADLLYVTVGAALEFGIDIDAVFRIVHEANMRKVSQAGIAAMREDGKVLKPEGWTPPDVAGELRRQGWAG